MQARQTMIALLAAMTVFYVALFLFSRIWPAQPPAPNSKQPTTSTAPAEGGETATRPTSGPVMAETGPAGTVTRPTGEFEIVEGQSREVVSMGGAEANSPYPMLIEINPVDAQVMNAWIRGHYETVQRKEPYQILKPVTLPTGGTAGSFATPEIRFDNLEKNVSLMGRTWSLDSSSTDTRKVWTLLIEDSNRRPLARVLKTYELKPEPASSRRYDLALSLAVENLSREPARLVLTQRGPVGMRREYQRSEDRGIIVGTWNGEEVKTAKHDRKQFAKAPNGTLNIGKDDQSTRLAWVAESNNYFTCIMSPAGRTSANVPALFSSVDGQALDQAEAPPEMAPSDMTYRFATVPVEVAPGKTAEVGFDCYVGPKSKYAFQNVPEYRKLDYYAVMTAGFYACAPTALTGLMMWLLDTFHRIPPHNYGVSIILLVLLVRLILHPITKRSQVNMMKMQKNMARLQPKIEAVKQRYANDRTAMNQAIMEVYKEEGVNPAGSVLTCLPLMLQIPIWGALWQALASTIEMRHAPFDGFWIKDLAGQDALISFSHAYDVPIISTYLTGPISAFNLLPILLGISQMLQMKYMPKSTAPSGTTAGPAADQMEQQRKMMMYMSVFFMLMLYNAPAGLNLYIMASNLFGILEQWRIRKHIADLEAKAPKEPPVSSGGGPGGGKRPGSPDKSQKPSWLWRKWEALQKQAEDAKRLQSRRDR